MVATAIGLDVGTNAVRAVEVELTDPPLVRRMGQVGLPFGAVVDGEVADAAAVSLALQRLWAQAGFKSRAVRVGMSSARVLVRTIEMPRLSHDELMSAMRLQLDEYVPLPPEDTVFAIRTLDGADPASQTAQLLLAATHRDAVEPLVMALHNANLDAAAIDVIPAALALSLTRPEPDQDDSVDIVLSIGAGTVVVVAARAGELVFSRTLTNASGRFTTERIASMLAIAEPDAERYKRLGATNDTSSAVALQASAATSEELINEVRATLAFYAEQPSARPVRRLLLTGGGSLLPGLASAFAEQLGLVVEPADPFVHVRVGDTGFEPVDLPYLAPYMAAAIGVALGAVRPKDRRIDLTPIARHTRHVGAVRRLLLASGAVVLVGAAGAFYVHGRSELTSARDELAAATAHLGALQTTIDTRSSISGAPSPAAGLATAHQVAASVADLDIDWPAVKVAIESGSAPHGVIISSFQGVLDVAVATPGTAPSAVRIGKITLTATAPSIPAVADWLDTIAADPKFSGPWASGLASVSQSDGSSAVQFTMELYVTGENLVDRSATIVSQP